MLILHLVHGDSSLRAIREGLTFFFASVPDTQKFREAPVDQTTPKLGAAASPRARRPRRYKCVGAFPGMHTTVTSGYVPGRSRVAGQFDNGLNL